MSLSAASRRAVLRQSPRTLLSLVPGQTRFIQTNDVTKDNRPTGAPRIDGEKESFYKDGSRLNKNVVYGGVGLGLGSVLLFMMTRPESVRGEHGAKDELARQLGTK